ncbi:MAG TPA: hypothetical protein VFR03_11995, partial [Thermoanaerobaculia bacterium]|nr:hypothetical protein [Thermoanaerobaculia bacterium]
QSASTLAFYEESYFRSPSPLSERLWRRAERAHLRSSLTYERARLELTARREEPRPRREPPVVGVAARGTRLLEKQLVGKEVKSEALTRRAARNLWARTPLGQTVLAAAHPLRAVAQASPASATLLNAIGTSAEVLRRSLGVYAELRAAQDRFRASHLPRGQRDLLHGDFSSRSLAAAVIRHREAVAPPVPASLPEAVRGARKAEADLLRTYRRFGKGLAAEPALVSAAARALAARAAVTGKVHQALGIPSYRELTALLGSQEGRALSAWIGTLQRAGLSARSIATSVAQIVPTAAASTVAAIAVIGARRLVRWVADHLRTRALEILREQNEQRR